jgi:hypothetical protein
MFQIVRTMLDDSDHVIGSRTLQLLFELRDHAMTIAGNEASGLWGDYGFDQERHCWWATDARGRQYRFVVQEVAPGGAHC